MNENGSEIIESGDDLEKKVRELRYRMYKLQRDAVEFLETNFREGVDAQQEIDKLTVKIEKNRKLLQEFEELKKSASEFGVEVQQDEEFINAFTLTEGKLKELEAHQNARNDDAITVAKKPGVIDAIHGEALQENSKRNYERSEKLRPLQELATDIYVDMTKGLHIQIPALGEHKYENVLRQVAWDIGRLLDESSSFAEIEKIIREPATHFLKDNFGEIRLLPEDIKDEVIRVLSQNDKIKQYFELKQKILGDIK